jgi:hypothetical protein
MPELLAVLYFFNRKENTVVGGMTLMIQLFKG